MTMGGGVQFTHASSPPYSFTGPEIDAFVGRSTKVIMNYTMCRPKRHSWKRYFCTRSATKFVWSVLNCMFSVLPLESFYSVFKILHDTMCPNQRRITWQSFSHSQPTFLHIIVPSWQLPVSMHQTGSLICNQHNKLMVKMTILFLRYIYIYDAASSSCRATIDL